MFSHHEHPSEAIHQWTVEVNKTDHLDAVKYCTVCIIHTHEAITCSYLHILRKKCQMQRIPQTPLSFQLRIIKTGLGRSFCLTNNSMPFSKLNSSLDEISLINNQKAAGKIKKSLSQRIVHLYKSNQTFFRPFKSPLISVMSVRYYGLTI